jgi:hypothetical protein
MRVHRVLDANVLDEVLIGVGLGALVLGVGGRVVMRVIAVVTDRPLLLSVGGTITIIAAGAAAGAAGGVLHAISRVVTARGGSGSTVLRVGLFALLLGLVTWRGLHGTPAAQAVAFWPLVAIYGVLLERGSARHRQRRSWSGRMTPTPAA